MEGSRNGDDVVALVLLDASTWPRVLGWNANESWGYYCEMDTDTREEHAGDAVLLVRHDASSLRFHINDSAAHS